MSNAIRQTDSQRLSRWVHDHGRAVQGFLVSLVGDRHVAEDLTQETFCRAWEARERYDDIGRERGYLLRIADRLARDHGRRRGREIGVDQTTWQVIEPVDDLTVPEANAAQYETERQLQTALRALSEPQRRALLLRYYGQLEFQEIATALNCPIGTALSHAHRGLSVLRKLLTGHVS
jgi:RNA polymerase sigma-70 factor (ECF subfamily)